MNRNPHDTFSTRAFTLLELLVAMAIMSLLVVLLMTMVDNASKLWRANESRVESYREARAALNLISTDLKSIYSSTNPAYFQTNASGFNFSTNDGRIFFLSALPMSAQDSGNKSDLCEVGYYLTYTNNPLNPNSESGYSLFRFFRSSDRTFSDLKSGTGMFSYSTTNTELLARNIPQFKVTCYAVTNGVPSLWTQSTSNPMPDFIELQITAFNNDTAKRLKEATAWKDTNSQLYLQNSRTFTTRIPVRQPN